MKGGFATAAGSDILGMMTRPDVPFWRALYALFFISLVRFKPGPRLWATHLVLANTCGLLFFPRAEPVLLWISITLGLIFMAEVYRRQGFVRLLGAGHALWLGVLPWLTWRALHIPAGENTLFKTWLVWVILTDTVCLILDARDVFAYIKGDRAPYYS